MERDVLGLTRSKTGRRNNGMIGILMLVRRKESRKEGGPQDLD